MTAMQWTVLLVGLGLVAAIQGWFFLPRTTATATSTRGDGNQEQ